MVPDGRKKVGRQCYAGPVSCQSDLPLLPKVVGHSASGNTVLVGEGATRPWMFLLPIATFLDDVSYELGRRRRPKRKEGKMV